MSYDTFSGSNYLETSVAAGGTKFASTYGVPLTMVAWIRRTAAQWSAANTGYTLSMGEAEGDWNPSINHWTSAADYTYITSRSTAPASAVSYYGHAAISGQVDDLWVPIVAVFNSTTDRDGYIISSSYTWNDTTSSDVGANLDTLRIGCIIQGTSAFDGEIAEVAIFSNAWTSTEVDQLQTAAETGPAPNTIDSANCIGYWSLNSSQSTHADESGNGGPTLGVVGSAAYNAAHPTITSASTSIPIYAHHYTKNLA